MRSANHTNEDVLEAVDIHWLKTRSITRCKSEVWTVSEMACEEWSQ